MATPVENFADVEVSTGYGASATSIDVETGGGSRFPSTFPYPCTWWNSTDYASPARDPNREIVTVTNRSGDTFTITRAAEGTSATTKNTASKTYRLSLGITKAMWDELASGSGAYVSGLSLGTSPHADLSVKQVELFGVDTVIMDDGTILNNANGEWTGLTADITVSGAGGLDTGAEAAAALYDIYAIAKADGTRNILLHRAALAAIDTLNSDSDATQAIRAAAGNDRVSQGFTLTNSGVIPYVELLLQKVGSPTGQLVVEIQSNNAGVPSGTVLATACVMDVSRLSTSAKVIRIPMHTFENFSASTLYHLVVTGTWTVNGSDYLDWAMDGSAGAYAGGAKALYNSGTATWTTDTDDDMVFNAYVVRFESPVTMPSGYTKKRHLGYVWNYGGGSFNDFIPFRQLGRRCTFLNAMDMKIKDETNAGPQLYDLGSTLLPWRPGAMIVSVALTGTGSAVATYALGDWQATDLSSSTGAKAQAVLHAPLTAEVPCAYAEISMRYGCLYGQGTTSADLYLTGFEW